MFDCYSDRSDLSKAEFDKRVRLRDVVNYWNKSKVLTEFIGPLHHGPKRRIADGNKPESIDYFKSKEIYLDLFNKEEK